VSEPVTIELPTPFPVGAVNVYLLVGDSTTLIDTGPRYPAAREALEDGLRANGVALTDIEQILLTHHHTDHVGLAAAIRSKSGCAVLAHPYAAAELRDLHAAVVGQHDWNSALLLRHGAPTAVVEGLYSRDPSRTLGDSVEVDRILADGETIRAGSRDLTVVFRPGHSLGDAIFVDADGWALLGDHLLADGPAVAFADRPLGASTDPAERPRALLEYRASLAATAELQLRSGFPGHGPPVADVRGAIDARYALHRRRAERLRRELTNGARTAWQLVETIRGGRIVVDRRHPVPDAFVVFSDVLAHLDLLVEQGRATETTLDSGVLAYAPVG
jgi:glyoxylase-like metal-dependent hydrolase (beta-lactamase superfamily II)